MKVIPEGSIKYLFFNDSELARNVQRRNGGAPAVMVAEVDEKARGGLTFHSGYSVMVEGTIATTFGGTNGSKPIFKYLTGYLGRRADVRAAFTTSAKVYLSESADEVLALKATPKPKAAKPAKPEEKSK